MNGTNRIRIVAAVVAAGSLLAVGASFASAADPDGGRSASAQYLVPENSVDSLAVINGEVKYADLGANSVASSKIQDNGVTTSDILNDTVTSTDIKNGTVGANDLAVGSVASSRILNNSVVEEDLSTGVRAKLNGPVTLPNWGQILRNTIGNGTSVLGTTSSGEGLTVTTPSAADQTTFGNEADFAGKPVASTLSAVKFTVFTTGENSAKGTNNMPSIKFEIKNPVAGKTYTTLVYGPDNSAANTWTTLDAKADPENHWGFSGLTNEQCGMNGSRCTLAEALNVLDPGATLISAAVGKGRDFEFHGAVKDLTVGADTFKFTAAGVTK